MPLLERLDLSGNHISSLAHRALQGMPLLRVLDLTHNKISLLGEDYFEGLPALKVRSGYLC
jgi:Leucine-rich repeat (LRR) protein